MTPAERRLILLVQKRVARMEPAVAKAYLRAIEILQQAIGIEDTTRLIQSGQYDIFDEETLERAFLEFRSKLQQGVQESFTDSIRELPRAGVVNGVPLVRFDFLNDRVRQAIAQLDRRILQQAKDEIRETVRQAIGAGLEAGQHPRTVARRIRDAVGLAPSHEQAVRNLREQLLEGKFADARERKLLDKRFNLEKLAKLPEKERLAQIDRFVAKYRQSFEAYHAETISRTATIQAYKVGQRSSYQAAIDAGIIDRDRAMKTWVNVGDHRVRPEHEQRPPNGVAGETVPFYDRFSNGELIPGESTYNCRCLARYWMAPRRG